MDPDEQLSQDGPGAAGDIGPSQDSEEIAEVVGESDEQPVAAASAPVGEGDEREGSDAGTVEDVLRELQRENDQLRQTEEAPSQLSNAVGGAPADGASDAIATSDAELLQQLEKENLELRLARDAAQIQMPGGEQAVLIASLLAVVAQLEKDTRTATVKPTPGAVPAPDNSAPAGGVAPRAQRPGSGGRVRPERAPLGSPVPLSNWSGAGGGVRRPSPQTRRPRAPSPAGAQPGANPRGNNGDCGSLLGAHRAFACFGRKCATRRSTSGSARSLPSAR